MGDPRWFGVAALGILCVLILGLTRDEEMPPLKAAAVTILLVIFLALALHLAGIGPL